MTDNAHENAHDGGTSVTNPIGLIRSFAVMNRIYLAYFTQSLETKNLSYSEGIYLVNIAHAPGISQDGLARELVIDKGAIARGVKSLKAKGLVSSERSAENGRENRLSLTPAGIEIAGFINGLNVRWIEGIMGNLTPGLRDGLVEGVALMEEAARGFSG